METIDLDLEETNELSFKLRIEGETSGAVIARLYCESPDGVMHAFLGNFQGDPGTVSFKLAGTNRFLNEGLHPAWVEVVVENKQFVPAKFNINFKKEISVEFESLQEVKKTAPVSVSAVSVKKTVSTPTKQITPPAPLSVAKTSPLREHIAKKTATGIADQEMEEVARSVMSRLISKDFGGKDRK